ncbi:hypothetical protein [Metabacillus fastidiosus]|uniref:Uncharacterized protein n=1 Tax=Metabacillus fastidiosus TaxID=1458 RepID=A0ABU6P156_9BACI|nr:hypothetical protein [Metabacillus fastidiosus]MED4402392.1 hypothetical protein [Metabacillus fastidiosus]MED4462264.1 hypothetical protein [Metabacillus fastidiosus]
MIENIYELKSSPLIELSSGEEANIDLVLQKKKSNEPEFIKICISVRIMCNKIILVSDIKVITVKLCIIKKRRKKSKRRRALIRVLKKLNEIGNY